MTDKELLNKIKDTKIIIDGKSVSLSKISSFSIVMVDNAPENKTRLMGKMNFLGCMINH